MKKLHKNSNIMANSIRAYACVSYCFCAVPGCPAGAGSDGMKDPSTGGGFTLPYY